jgi:hypothetical protein
VVANKYDAYADWDVVNEWLHCMSRMDVMSAVSAVNPEHHANIIASLKRRYRKLSDQPRLQFFLFFKMFFGIFVIFSSVALQRGQLAAKCNPRW